VSISEQERHHQKRNTTAPLDMTLCCVLAPDFPDPGRAPMSREKQVQLGLQAAAKVYQQMPVLPDSSPETQYIQSLGKRLVAVIPKDRTCHTNSTLWRKKKSTPLRFRAGRCL
jgi:predicted Zn-dependent protease